MEEKKKRKDPQGSTESKAEEKKEKDENKDKKEDGAELLKRIEELQVARDEYKDKWMRSVAEFDNYKKRNARLWNDAFNEGIASVVVKILPVGDNLDWALTLGLDEKTQDGLKEIKRKYDETLKGMGIEAIDPLGKKFDPNEAEAVMQVEKGDGEESDTVKQVFQKGYRKDDKIIRYAKVSVIK